MTDFNWGHFVGYFLLALFVYTGLGEKWGGFRGKVLTVIICVLYGVTDEYHQVFIPNRTPDLMDIRNDAIGACVAMLFISIPVVRKMYLKLVHLLFIKY